MRSKLSINVYFPYNWKSCIQYSYTSILFHSPSKSPIFNHIIRQKYRNYTLTTRWIETYLHLFKISTITKKNSKFHNPSPDEERLKIQQPRRITTNRRVRWITSLLSFSFPNPAASRRYLRIHAADAHNGADSWHLIRALSRLAPRLPPYNSLYSS